jgi:glycosyltransferase involved in cell wall biosynthesis
MSTLSRAAASGARTAWLWRNRFDFVEDGKPDVPRLLVDVSEIMRRDAQTGIQRVVRAVYSELHRRSGRTFLVQPVFATSTRGYCHAPIDFLTRTRAAAPPIPRPVKARSNDRFLGLDLSAHLLPHYRPQLAAWKAHGATVHLVVYDLLPLDHPEWFSPTTVFRFRRWFDFLVQVADQAICISDQVARNLRSRLGLNGPSIGRLQMGADIVASVPSTGVSADASPVLRRIASRPGILMVGTVEPRKGYSVALQAFEELWRSRPADAPDLVIIGKPGWKTSALQRTIQTHPEQGKRLHWLKAASDEVLCRLYRDSAGLLVASYGEGFGLPLVEAAMFQRKVLARDLPVFREQRLPNVRFFRKDGATALGALIMELADPGKSQTALVASLPTWSDCVDGLLHEVGIESEDEVRTDSPLRKAS